MCLLTRPRRSRGTFCRLASLLAGLWIALALSVAEARADALTDSDRSQLEQRKEALFQQMLHEPGNLDVTFAYADVSAKLGDNEAAVSALERMLLFNPNLPRVDLELGVLYFRMGSFDVAQTYFQKAAAANPPQEVKDRIAEYEAQIAKQESPLQFSGSLFFGIQYQSDANVAPGSATIISPITGQLLSLSPQFVKQHDFNAFAAGNFLLSYDLGTQDRDTFEVGGNTYVNHYFMIPHFDIDFAEVTAGPRFRFPNPGPSWVESATLKPYLIANEVALGENQYFATYGTGLEATAVLPWDIQVKNTFEFRQKYFTNALDRPLSTGLDGNDKLVSLFATKTLTPNSAVGVELDYLDQDTSFAFYANKTYSGALSYRVRYDDPTGLLRMPWETVAFIGRSWAYYDAPDPCCVTGGTAFSPGFSDRYDRHWRGGLTQTFPLTDRISVIAQVQRDIVSSNLPIYAYTSDSALIGAQIKF
jgi:tetratricopeptide (TPR) repeat protein